MRDARLRILHVNTTDLAGGAARAAFRLHEALKARAEGNIDSYVKPFMG